mmetsp:Transcript_42227/g.104060  ORF Transcript_42227/g.104060 Transcript_42227/m.104060 type:complete len:202 (+) Transcript_42227:757-1362(+)
MRLAVRGVELLEAAQLRLQRGEDLDGLERGLELHLADGLVDHLAALEQRHGRDERQPRKDGRDEVARDHDGGEADGQQVLHVRVKHDGHEDHKESDHVDGGDQQRGAQHVHEEAGPLRAEGEELLVLRRALGWRLRLVHGHRAAVAGEHLPHVARRGGRELRLDAPRHDHQPHHHARDDHAHTRQDHARAHVARFGERAVG